SLDRSHDDWHEVSHTEMAQFDVVRARSRLITIESPGLPAPCYIDDASILSVPYVDTPPGSLVVEQDAMHVGDKWAQVVDDPAALDGQAAQLLGSRSTWGVQYRLKNMPQTGRYHLYARVRLDMTDDVGDDDNVLY